MQILSYNPQDDEFFIGLSLRELEQISNIYIVDYGYHSNYEIEKEKAIKKQSDKSYNEMLKEFYQVKNIPLICIVTDRNCSTISIREKHFPFANLWNGYSPWQRIEVLEIDTLDFCNIKINYIQPSYVIKSFCNEWIKKFSDKNISHYQLIEDSTFPNYCFSFGWNVDNGESFMQHYNCCSYEDALKHLPRVTEVKLLGSLLFSYWRYFNHWAYSSDEILCHKEWFIKVLTRLEEIAINM